MPSAIEMHNVEPRPMSDGVMDLQPEHLRQTRSQISALVAEIATAAKTHRNQDTFFAVALERLREAMGAVGAGIWQYQEQQWTLLAQFHLPSSLLCPVAVSDQAEHNKPLSRNSHSGASDSITQIDARLDQAEELFGELANHRSISEAFDDRLTTRDDASELRQEELSASYPTAEHRRILDVVRNEKHATLIPPKGNEPPPGKPPNPSEHCLILAPITFEGSTQQFWLQAVVRPTGGPTIYRGYLRFVVQIADIISDFLKSVRLRELIYEKSIFDTAQSMLMALDGCREQELSSAQQHQAIEEQIVARSVMNWAQADEAFFVFHGHDSSRLKISARANDLRIADHGEAATVLRRFVNTARKSDDALQPKLWTKNDDGSRVLLDNFGASVMAWLPILLTPDSTRDGLVVLLLFWYREDTPGEADRAQRPLADIHAVARLGTRFATGSPVGQTYRTIVEAKHRTTWLHRTLSKASVRVGILVGCFSIVCCIPVPLTITAPAVLMPKKIQTIYAPATGVVEEVTIRYGQNVAADQVLLRIKSDAIENEHESLVAERVENEQRRKDIELHLLRSNDLTAQQRSSLEGELQTLNVIARTQSERLSLLEKQLEKLTVRARIDGVVGTWNVETKLASKPVSFGQPIATIYDPEDEWGFEIELQEKDLAAFSEHMQRDKPVAKCRLDASPLKLIDLQLDANQKNLVLHQTSDGGFAAPVYASVDTSSLQQLTPGATATVEVVVGKQPVIWVLTRDLVMNTWAKIRLWI